MSFRIQKSDKLADQFTAKKSDANHNDLLTSEDYLLFNLDSKSSASMPKSKKGGNSIHRVSSARADFY